MIMFPATCLKVRTICLDKWSWILCSVTTVNVQDPDIRRVECWGMPISWNGTLSHQLTIENCERWTRWSICGKMSTSNPLNLDALTTNNLDSKQGQYMETPTNHFDSDWAHLIQLLPHYFARHLFIPKITAKTTEFLTMYPWSSGQVCPT